MIIVYPMLISENVNKDIIPGLAKSIENYILIYNTDILIKQVNNSAKKLVKVGAAGAFTIGVSVAAAIIAKKIEGSGKLRIKKQGKDLVLKEASSSKPPYDPNQLQTPAKAFQTSASQLKQDMALKGGVKRIETPKYDQLSIEPTWVQVQTDSGTKILGVKVVPYTVKTDSMVALLLNDTTLRTLPAITKKYGRIAIRVLLRAWKTIKKAVPGIQSSPVTGDAKNDIVWANTEYKENLFICLSQLDIDQSDFKGTPYVMQKLKQLGWASMIFADDVNKQATYCMKEFGGVCSSIPYTHVYASFGKEHSRVYSDLQDAQKSTGPFFRRKSTTIRKIFS